MSVVLVLVTSILYPALIYKVLAFIHRKWNLRLYWILVPICVVLGILVPYLFYYASSPSILFTLKAMTDYSVKTGFMIMFVIPSVLSGLICTLIGYLRFR